MEAKKFIIHGIAKERNSANVALNLRDGLLPIDEKAERFIETAFKLFNRQNKGLLFAGFTGEGARVLFRDDLSRYYSQSELSFLEFTRQAMTHLRNVMEPVTFATGGFVIFCHVAIDGEDRLCVLLLSQELRFAVDEENLTLRDVPSLNLDRMGVGCFVSLTRWIAEEVEPVAFIRGSRDVSDYFMNFIGAAPEKKPKDASKQLASFANSFLAAKPDIPDGEKSARLGRMYAYCVAKQKAREPVDLNEISAIVSQESPDEFREAANGDNISAEFHVDHRYMKFIVQVEFKTPGVALSMTRQSIRERVSVDLERQALTIRNIPTEKLSEFREALI